jgi:hypothetical protein
MSCLFEDRALKLAPVNRSASCMMLFFQKTSTSQYRIVLHNPMVLPANTSFGLFLHLTQPETAASPQSRPQQHTYQLSSCSLRLLELRVGGQTRHYVCALNHSSITHSGHGEFHQRPTIVACKKWGELLFNECCVIPKKVN